MVVHPQGEAKALAAVGSYPTVPTIRHNQASIQPPDLGLWLNIGKRLDDPKSGGETEVLRGLLFVVGLLLVLWSASASSATPGTGRFDGRWGVILVCPRAPDGALPWTFEFTADVKEAILHGEHGLCRPAGLAVA